MLSINGLKTQAAAEPVSPQAEVLKQYGLILPKKRLTEMNSKPNSS